jgi:hypothetical protein
MNGGRFTLKKQIMQVFQFHKDCGYSVPPNTVKKVKEILMKN